jgi:hypothetical protein
MNRGLTLKCVQCGHVADATAQEAMLVNIQQAREADAQGAKDDPEPSGRGRHSTGRGGWVM